MNFIKIETGQFFKILLTSGIVILSMIATSNAYANAIGEVKVAKGKVVSRSDTRETTELTKGAAVYAGDMIETIGRSFLVVQFNDGGKIVLRPDSQLNIDAYNDTPGQEKEEFSLIKGGLRAVTGAIGKNRPDNVTFTASNTTMGIRGTTFVIKLCDKKTEACAKSDNDKKLSDDQKQQLEDLFLSDEKTGNKEKIEVVDLDEVVEGLFVQVEEGGVRVKIGDKFFDLNPGGACEVTKPGAVRCFKEGLDLSNFDVFISTEGGTTSSEEDNVSKDETLNEGSNTFGNADGTGTALDANLGTTTTPGAGASPIN